MIVPITIEKNGETVRIGSAVVESADKVFHVDFYLNPRYSLPSETKAVIAKKLRDLSTSNTKNFRTADR